MKKAFLPIIGIGAASLILGLGCKPATNYGNARAVETLNADFGSTDLQIIADKIVASLIASNRLQSDTSTPNQLPLISVTRLRNGTSEHIDTKSITDKIRTALIRSGKVRFSALDMQQDLMDQYDLQQSMAVVQPGKLLEDKLVVNIF